ncbi:MAG TPA: hypothetical protein VHZ76_04930 [Gammaproteobacteria bacterium]|jgi:hypothetical protein|nr:hypothetical protein [Gammaproteobacteria bacterium]
MLNNLDIYFDQYPQVIAPFMHAQYNEWKTARPYKVYSNVTDLSQEDDNRIIDLWCQFHQFPKKEIEKWFMKYS